MGAIRFDSTSWLPGAVLFGNAGFGVRGDQIAASGSNGPGYAFKSLTFPADAAKEICGRILVLPTNGTLEDVGEDAGLKYIAFSDGVDSFTWQLYEDGVPVGSPVVTPLTVGGAAASFTPAPITLTAPVFTAVGGSAGSASASFTPAPIALTTPAFTASGGSAVAGNASFTPAGISLTAPAFTGSNNLPYTPSDLFVVVPIGNPVSLSLADGSTRGVLEQFEKQPSEVLSYDIVFTPWLEALNDSAKDFSVVAPAGLTLATQQLTARTQHEGIVSVFLGGGLDAVDYKVTIRLMTNAGRTREEEIRIQVREL